MERFVFVSRLTVAFVPSDSLSVVCKTVRIFAYSSTYARAVKQKVWNEAKNREQDWGKNLRACEARARKTLTPRITDFFTDFEKKTDCFAVSIEWAITSAVSVKIVKESALLLAVMFFHFIALISGACNTSSVKHLWNFGVFSLFQTSRDHVTSLEQTVVPHHDYFSAQFLLQFSAQSIYHVTVSSSVIDSFGILWNTGPQNNLQIKTTDSASRKQRTSRS